MNRSSNRPLREFSESRSRTFVEGANEGRQDDLIDFGPEYNKDVAMALISAYLEHYDVRGESERRTLGTIALEYLSLKSPEQLNRRHGRRGSGYAYNTLIRAVGAEAAMIVDNTNKSKELARTAGSITEHDLAELFGREEKPLGSLLDELYQDNRIDPELYVGLRILFHEVDLPSDVNAQTISSYEKLARNRLLAKIRSLKPGDSRFPPHIKILLHQGTDGSNIRSFDEAVEAFRASSAIEFTDEQAAITYKRQLSHELGRLYEPLGSRNMEA